MRLQFDSNKNYPCAYDNGGDYKFCDGLNPLKLVTNESVGSALGVLFGLYIVCYFGAWWILASLKKNFD
jgi:hypothetical protein